MERQGMGPVTAIFYICCGVWLVVTHSAIQWIKSTTKRWFMIGD
jgi:hypothetical protein